MVDLMCCLTNFLFFDIPLLYCYPNLNSSIICCYPNLNSSIISCLSSRGMCLLFGTSISSFCNSLECNSVGDFL